MEASVIVRNLRELRRTPIPGTRGFVPCQDMSSCSAMWTYPCRTGHSVIRELPLLSSNKDTQWSQKTLQRRDQPRKRIFRKETSPASKQGGTGFPSFITPEAEQVSVSRKRDSIRISGIELHGHLSREWCMLSLMGIGNYQVGIWIYQVSVLTQPWNIAEHWTSTEKHPTRNCRPELIETSKRN